MQKRKFQYASVINEQRNTLYRYACADVRALPKMDTEICQYVS